jgi:hypothetical protein
MPTISLSKKEKVLATFVLVAALTRLLPHPPNFAPITAMALFSGVFFDKRTLGLLVPLSAMVISDLFLGFYTISIFVYLSFFLITLFGRWMKKIHIGSVLLASTLFFLISNLGVWLLAYPLTVEGLITCFTLAIPFFGSAILGDVFYSLVLVYGFKAVERKWALA